MGQREGPLPFWRGLSSAGCSCRKKKPEKHTGRFSLAQSSSALSASTGPVTASYDVHVPRIVCERGLHGGSSLLSEEIRTWRRVEKPRSSLTESAIDPM